VKAIFLARESILSLEGHSTHNKTYIIRYNKGISLRMNAIFGTLLGSSKSVDTQELFPVNFHD